MMFLHDKKHSSLFLSEKKYYSLRHLGSRAYRFKFDVSYHIFRHVEIWNMHCILNHLGIEKKILSFNSVLDKFTHIVSNFHISQIAHFWLKEIWNMLNGCQLVGTFASYRYWHFNFLSNFEVLWYFFDTCVLNNKCSFKLQLIFIYWCWNIQLKKERNISRKMGKPTKNTLLKAILTRNMLKCDMCSLQFDNKYAYDLHWSLVHSTPNVFNIKPKSRKVK